MAARAARKLLWPVVGLAAAGTLLHAAWLLGLDHRALKTFVDDWLYNGVVAVAGLACLLRAMAIREGRGPWIAFGLGLISWAAADVYWTANFENASHVPAPSWADVGYLATLALFYAGVALLLRERIGSWSAARIYDAIIASLATATIATAFLAPALINLTMGDPGVVFTNLAYPVGDVLLVAVVIGGIVALKDWQSRPMLFVGLGLGIWAIADAWYMYLDATNAYRGGFIDSLWLIGAVAIGAAAATSTGAPLERQRDRYRSSVVPPVLAALAACAALVWDHFSPQNDATVWLAAATLLVVTVRLVLTFRQNSSLLRTLQHDAITDALTGLGNRRELFRDLDAKLDGRSTLAPYVLAIFDLDGFKNYNDAFGHPAGDALLRRLGWRLDACVRPKGTAYRLGGDEFCLIARASAEGGEDLVARARAALGEAGEGFTITASAGSALIPDEARSPREAVRLADRRMYTEKTGRAGRNELVARNILLQILRDREPTLSNHQRGVAELARRLAHEVGLDAEEIDVVTRAAELHDVGKIAIPDEILSKRGPLTAGERELMETHTLVGERILSGAPAMAPVAVLVRHSHERWDGAGYPDGIAEESIPLGSRLIFICDSFEAMTTGRPYRAPSSFADAMAELSRCAGTQFDPRLVEIFSQKVAPGEALRRASPGMLPVDVS
jgi:diguanylate cyclase (GGDEF)-like protein